MHYQYSPYLLPLIAIAAISAAVAIYAGISRTKGSTWALAGLSLAIMLWSMGYALEIAGTELPTKLFWAKCNTLVL